MKQNIYWLASYPKSGNTWFRFFLSTILGEANDQIDINKISDGRNPIASSQDLFDKYIDIESSCLTLEEIDNLRPDVYREFSSELTDTEYMKVHDAFTTNLSGEWIFPPEITKSVIYIVRNPLDVTVSYANHSGKDIETMVSNICNTNNCLCKRKHMLHNQLRQNLLGWSDHASSWINSPNKLCLIRYEDMKLNPLETFKRAMNTLELNKTDKEILDSLEKSSFKNLQNQEKNTRFKEAPQRCKSFFRKGIIGDWRNHLTEEQAQRIITTHSKVMKQLGYIDENNRLTV